MVVFHDSSQRECCILCHGDTAAVNEETDVCECGPGSKPIVDGECGCKDKHLLNDSGDECILCFSQHCVFQSSRTDHTYIFLASLATQLVIV